MNHTSFDRHGVAGPRARRALQLSLCLALAFSAWTGAGCDDDAGGTTDASGGGGAGGAGGQGGDGGAGGQGGDGGAGGQGDGGASCIDDTGCPAGARCDRAEGTCRPACRDDDQCGASARCSAGGFCAPLVACPNGAADCAAGTVCDCHGVCVENAGNACAGDLSCAVEDYCDACLGHCAPRATPCQRCNADNGCERRTDVCHPVGEAGLNHCLRGCTGAANCDALGPGYTCEMLPGGRQACVPESGDCRAVAGCGTDGDCPTGHYCNDRLQCQRGCMNDVECPAGLLCQGIRCAPPCTEDADCGVNASCHDDGKCGVPPGGCLSSADCAEPATYCDVNAQVCVAGCQRDDDCQNANQACQDGNCVRRGCSGNFQCAFGEVCNLQTATCELAMGRHCEADCNPEESETSCGSTGQRCLSLQDEDENPLGDYCFEPCAEAPNECPQGYQCVELENQDGMVDARLCIRRCDLDPFR